MATGLYIGSTPIAGVKVGTFSENGYDTSSATATASDILNGETAFGSSGKITGNMPNNGAVSQTLSTSTTSYTIPEGYHSGTGAVSISLEEKTITPTTSVQTITPSNGKVLSKVIVNASSSGGTGGIDTSDATATASDILSGKTAYVKGSKVTGTIASKAAATYTPGTSNQTISSGQYLSGTQTIAGDSDLVAANIKSGVSIFNVSGSYTSDATATAADVVSGKTAYVKGSKVTGSLVVQHYYTGTSAPSSSLGSNGDIYLKTT